PPAVTSTASCRTTSSRTFWTSTSAPTRPGTSWTRRSTGAATRSVSTTRPTAGASTCPRPEDGHAEASAGDRPGVRAGVAPADGARGLLRHAGALLRRRRRRRHLARPLHPRGDHLPPPQRPPPLRRLLAAAPGDRLRPEPLLRARLRLPRGLPRQARARAHPPPGHPAVHPGPELPPGRDAGDDRALPPPPARRRDGGHPPYLHRPGVEHGLQLLLVVEGDPSGPPRDRAPLPLHRLAALHPARAALRGHRAGLELDDVGGRRLVLPHGLRDVRARRPRLPPAGAGLLPPGGRERRRHPRHPLGAGGDDRRHPPPGPAGLAAGPCLGRQVQDGAGRERLAGRIRGARFPPPLSPPRRPPRPRPGAARR